MDRTQGAIVSAGCIVAGLIGYRLAGDGADGSMTSAVVASVLTNAALAAAFIGRRATR